MSKLKYLIICLLLFLIFFFEPEPVGPITFSQLWKIPLFLYLIYQVLIFRKIKKWSFVKFSYLRAGKSLINGGMLIAPMAEIISFIKYMMFPLIVEFISIKVKEISKINVFLLGFAQFVILSGIPFVFFGLESRGKVIFELQEVHGYTGVFQGPHAASMTTAVAVLVIISFLKNRNLPPKSKIFNSSLLFLGIYFLFLTFVRTGYAMFAVGLIVMFLPRKLEAKQIVAGTIILSLLAFGFFYLLETNEFFYNRIFDIRQGKQTSAGSGRLIFWGAAVDLWSEGNFFELLFGQGLIGLQDKLFEVTGHRIVAHNEFFNQLAQNGLLGIIIFIGFLVTLFKFIWRRRSSISYRLALATFFLYISLMMTQGGTWFPVDIFMALIFVRLNLEHLDRI